MASWRSQFGAGLPFLVVQLPNFGTVPTKPAEANWATSGSPAASRQR